MRIPAAVRVKNLVGDREMTAAFYIFARMAGVLAAVGGGFASLALWLYPRVWGLTLWQRGVRSELLLQPPLWAAIAVCAAGVALIVVGLNDPHDPTKSTKESTSHGSARMATTAELRAKGYGELGVKLCMEESARVIQVPSANGAPVWRVEKPAPAIATSLLHTLVEGPTGSGKDVSIVVPTMVTDVGRSCVCLDPKGRTYELTSGFRSAFSAVFRFAPSEEASARYNPLAEIPMGSAREATEAERIASVLVGSAAREEMSSRIYLKSSELLLSCAILHVMNRRPKAEHNLPGVYRFLIDRNREKQDIVREMIKNPARYAVMAADSVAELAEDNRMLQGAFTTVLDVLSFCRMPLVNEAISGSDFVASDLSQREAPTTVYLVIPFRDADILRPLMRLMLDGLLAHHTVQRRHDTLYMLNEFASLGNIPSISRGVGELREFGVQLALFIQSEGQLYSNYGKEDARTLLDNCRARVTLGVSGQEAAEAASDRLGKATIVRPRQTQAVSRRSFFDTTVTNTKGEGEQARQLMTPDEVRSMDEDKLLIDLPALRTYVGKRFVYYAMPELLRRTQIDPPDYHRRTA